MKCFHPSKWIFSHSNDELTSLIEYPLCKEQGNLAILRAYFHVLAILGVDVSEALDMISSPFIGQTLS